jgi:hypothetical protein
LNLSTQTELRILFQTNKALCKDKLYLFFHHFLLEKSHFHIYHIIQERVICQSPSKFLLSLDIDMSQFDLDRVFDAASLETLELDAHA